MGRCRVIDNLQQVPIRVLRMKKVLLAGLVLPNLSENRHQWKTKLMIWVSTKSYLSWLKRISRKRKWEVLWALELLRTLQVVCLVEVQDGRVGELAHRSKKMLVHHPNNWLRVGTRMRNQMHHQEVSIILRCLHKVPHTKIITRHKVITVLPVISGLSKACFHLQVASCTSRSLMR